MTTYEITISRRHQYLGYPNTQKAQQVYQFFSNYCLKEIENELPVSRLGQYFTLLSHNFGDKDKIGKLFWDLIQSEDKQIKDYLASLDSVSHHQLGLSSDTLNHLLSNYKKFIQQFDDKQKEIINKIILKESLSKNVTKEVGKYTYDQAVEIIKPDYIDQPRYLFTQDLANLKLTLETASKAVKKRLDTAVERIGFEITLADAVKVPENLNFVNGILEFVDYEKDPQAFNLFFKSILELNESDKFLLVQFIKANKSLFPENFMQQKIQEYFEKEISKMKPKINWENANDLNKLMNRMSILQTLFPDKDGINLKKFRTHFKFKTGINQFKTLYRLNNLMQFLKSNPRLQNNIINLYLISANEDQRKRFVKAYVDYFGLEKAFIESSNSYLKSMILSMEDTYEIKKVFLKPSHPQYFTYLKSIRSISLDRTRELFPIEQQDKQYQRISSLRKNSRTILSDMDSRMVMLNEYYRAKVKNARKTQDKILFIQEYIERIEAAGFSFNDYYPSLLIFSNNLNNPNNLDKAILKVVQNKLEEIKDPKIKASTFILGMDRTRDLSEGILFYAPKESFLNRKIEELFLNQTDPMFYVESEIQDMSDMEFDFELKEKGEKKLDQKIIELFASGTEEKMNQFANSLGKAPFMKRFTIISTIPKNLYAHYENLSLPQRQTLLQRLKDIVIKDPRLRDIIITQISETLHHYAYTNNGAKFIIDFFNDPELIKLFFKDNSFILEEYHIFNPIILEKLIKKSKLTPDKIKAANLTFKYLIANDMSVVKNIEGSFAQDMFKTTKLWILKLDKVCPHLQNCNQYYDNLSRHLDGAKDKVEIPNYKELKSLIEKLKKKNLMRLCL